MTTMIRTKNEPPRDADGFRLRAPRRHATFDEWMGQVEEVVSRMTGLSTLDLPDVCYRDWFDDDVSPSKAARMAVRSAHE